MMQVRIYTTKQIVAEKFSAFFKDIVTTDKSFNVALSGGSTPKIVFDYLAENFADSIDWTKVNFYWGDERCVSIFFEFWVKTTLKLKLLDMVMF